MNTIGIRVDGNETIGMGHVMRCMSLAKELQALDMQVVFFSKFSAGIDILQHNHFAVEFISIQKDNDSKEGVIDADNIETQEIEELQQKLTIHQIDCLLVDTYAVSEKYFQALKLKVKQLIYIDDLNAFSYPVDMIINGNISAVDLRYIPHTKEQRVLLGVKYNLIRDEFRDLPPKEIREEVKEILLTTGGSNPYRATQTILRLVKAEPQWEKAIVHVIVGKGFVDTEDIVTLAKQWQGVELHIHPTKISELMLRADIAISSGGSTLYELCACGTPTLAFVLADNQRTVVNGLSREGYIISCGHFEELQTTLSQTIKEICINFIKRKDMSNRQRGLVDARGAERVARIVKDILK